ncbi:MAG: hypothetical protein JNM80_02655 [Phycisphaerae bacterium]|nr:hypothetical protein [Phycisphaerae bacterium]
MVRTWVVALVSVLAVWGCDSKARPMKDAQAAAAGAGGRAAVAKVVAEAFDAKRVTIGDMIDLAATRLEAEEAKPGGAATSQAATALAGGVLDAASMVSAKLPTSGELELFWMKMGRLAFRSADEAVSNGRLEEAESLMLAGPARWQTEAYWIRYPDHDALVAVVLVQRGKREEALHRLGSRPQLTGLAAEVYERLRGR